MSTGHRSKRTAPWVGAVVRDQESDALKRLSASAVVMTIIGCGPVAAQDVCVTCKGPEAVYRCSIEKSEKAGRFGSFGDKAIDLVCTKELARQGGHDSCAVRRDLAGAACAGIVREIPLASLLEAPARPAVPPAPAPASVPAPPAPTPGPPRTVQEMAERTGETSKQQLKDLGQSVGNAASKTWECLSSLFKKC